MDVKPFLHQHHLLYDIYEEQEACCDKCHLQIDGWAFTCDTCKFWLHESCAKEQLPDEISRPLHPQHLLALTGGIIDHSYSRCDKCFNLTRGFTYSCNDCNFNLDLIRASSSTTTNDDHDHDQRCEIIYHFSHCPDHLLTLFKYRKVEKDYHSCYWCHNLLSGMSYGCIDSGCSYSEVFFHESCLIDMPSIISKHHFHPSHPLHSQPRIDDDSCYVCQGNFGDDGMGYSCQTCSFSLLVGRVRLQPSLKHELHEHPLSYFPRKPLSRSHLRRNNCYTDIEGRSGFYHCMQCNNNLHIHCLQMSFHVEHEYHRHELMLMGSYVEDVSTEYYCDACEKQRKLEDPVYVCEKCSFVAHIGCALYKYGSTYNLEDNTASTQKLEQEETEQRNANALSFFQIENFHPKHPLSLTDVTKQNESIRCVACNMEISDQAYACEYYLHETCSALPFEVSHPLHPQHSLKLFANYDLRFVRAMACYGCRDSLAGFFYACFMCHYALDVKCAVLSVFGTEETAQSLKEMERRTKLCPFNQGHSLQLFNFVLDDEYGGAGCNVCDLPLAGPSYGCIRCSLLLHDSCLGFPRKMLLQFHLHPFYPLPTYRVLKRCKVCINPIKGIRYSCLMCNLHLHPRCVKYLKRTVRSKTHMHNLYYYRSKYEVHVTCHECKRSTSTHFHFFCGECDIKWHFECVKIPHSIKPKYHMHPLTLKDDATEHDSEEYHCDICEEERNPKDHVYSCTECERPFATHIDCGLETVEETALLVEASSSAGFDSDRNQSSKASTSVDQARNSRAFDN